MRLLYAIFLFLFVFSCATNSGNKQWELNNPRTVYFNHFAGTDKTFWTGNDGRNFAEVEDGYYYFEALDSSGRFNAPHFDIDSGQNYLVEIALTGPDTEDSSFYGLILGALNNDYDFVELRVNNAGEYYITSNELLDEGTYGKGLNTRMKKLKVVQKDLEAHFFINDSEVFTYHLQGFDNFRAGPVTAKQSAIWMDYFILKAEKPL